MNLHEFATRQDLFSQLATLGIEGEAAEALAKETAWARRARRIVAAREAMQAGAATLFEGVYDAPPSLPQYELLLVVLDLMGVGGRDGVGGAGTRRIPQFAALGSGRKQAMDGGAWTGAITDAAACIIESVGSAGSVRFLIDVVDVPTFGWELRVAIETYSSGEWSHVVSGLVEVTDARWAALRPWLRTLAREGLRRSAEIDGWHTLPSWVHFDTSSLTGWASLVNAVGVAKSEAST